MSRLPLRIPLSHTRVQGPLHRTLRRIAYWFNWKTLANALFAIVAILGVPTLTIFSADWGWWSTVLIILLVVTLGVRLIAALHGPQSKQTMRRRVVGSWLQLMHKYVFGNSADFRLTFLVRDPIVREIKPGTKDAYDILVPFIRHQSGEHASNEDFDNFRTRCYFPRYSNAAAADAWDKALEAKEGIDVNEIESFVTRAEDFENTDQMKSHYKDVLNIEEHIVDRLNSEYMKDVKEIFTVPIVDGRGRMMGLLSIDSKRHFSFPATQESAPAGNVQTINAEQLALWINVMRQVLSDIEFQAE